MESKDLDVRRQAIQQLVVELLAPYHSRLQPIELAWPSTTTVSSDRISLILNRSPNHAS